MRTYPRVRQCRYENSENAHRRRSGDPGRDIRRGGAEHLWREKAHKDPRGRGNHPRVLREGRPEESRVRYRGFPEHRRQLGRDRQSRRGPETVQGSVRGPQNDGQPRADSQGEGRGQGIRQQVRRRQGQHLPGSERRRHNYDDGNLQGGDARRIDTARV